MRGQEIYAIWAPPAATWSPWVSPVVFAHLVCVDSDLPPGAAIEDADWHEAKADSNSAVIIDLPGVEAVRYGAALARRGYRPVPILNASPSPIESEHSGPENYLAIKLGPISREVCATTVFLRGSLLPDNAPPAFILDSNRSVGSGPLDSRSFDNRWMVFPQDFPSAKFLTERQIERVIVVQRSLAQPSEDLGAVLLRWQKAGIKVLVKIATEKTAPTPIVITEIAKLKLILKRIAAFFGLIGTPASGFRVPNASG